MKKLPLILTLARIFVTIPVATLMLFQSNFLNWFAVILFVLASITDYYDGYFARKYNAVTNLGKFLDPVADKILVTTILIILLYQQKIDPWMVILFVMRDTLVGGIRAAASADGLVIPAQTTGKWKAALQMIAIPFMMVNELHPSIPTFAIGYGLLWFSVLLSLISGWDYFKIYLTEKS
ncbi:MAG: CDP-diacylglycerol--glycerol-3-phosphate 3-phosphatidyltransferase [Pseudobdellovibrio sp.]